MSDRGFPAADAYPERPERRGSAVEKILRSLAYLPSRLLAGASVRPAVVNPGPAPGRSDREAGLRNLRYELRQSGLRKATVAQALDFLARECLAVLGRAPTGSELTAARLLVRGGRCVELADVAAWPLATGLAAAVAALAGLHVHVVVATGFIARRDAQAIAPLLDALGLSAGVVDEGMPDDERRSAYAANVTWCVHRVVALDYLRDRLVLKGRPRAVRLRTEALTSKAPRMQQVLLRGLQFAIFCEAETVLVDAAQWPVTITADASSSQEVAWLTQALVLARALAPEEDFRAPGGIAVELTESGRERLAAAAKRLPGHWQGARRREEVVALAIAAHSLLRRDEHYGVSGRNLEPAEDVLRRLVPDAGTRRLLTMLLEIKEGCAVTGTREVTARMGYQRFFRRYLRSSALSAVAAGTGPELWNVYGLCLTRLPETGPTLRVRLRDRLVDGQKAVAEVLLGRVRELQAQAVPVLVVTRTPQAAAALADVLNAGGIECRRLLGAQTDEEAQAFAQAGDAGAVTVAPHYAARGVRASTSAHVQGAGGLRIVFAQLLASPRHERALALRCLAAGTPGSLQRIIGRDDDLLTAYGPSWLRRTMQPMPAALMRFCQWRAGREFAHSRSELFRTEEYLGDVLAFSGGPI